VTACDRCGQETRSTIMSMFNTDIICMACKDREKQRPDYKAAGDAEREAVRSGDFNFPGVGIPTMNQNIVTDDQLTPRQRYALALVYRRPCLHPPTSYRELRESVRLGAGCVMVPWAGMWL